MNIVGFKWTNFPVQKTQHNPDAPSNPQGLRTALRVVFYDTAADPPSRFLFPALFPSSGFELSQSTLLGRESTPFVGSMPTPWSRPTVIGKLLSHSTNPWACYWSVAHSDHTHRCFSFILFYGQSPKLCGKQWATECECISFRSQWERLRKRKRIESLAEAIHFTPSNALYNICICNSADV